MNGKLESAIQARLESNGPIRVALLGAGASAAMIIRHLLRAVPWIHLVAVANRNPSRGAAVIAEMTGRLPVEVTASGELLAKAKQGETVVTQDADLLCDSSSVDLVIEATGTIEFAARKVLRALASQKHVVLVNAELDSTLGPILKTRAEDHGVILTHTDGDEPGVAMTLLRYLQSLGLKTVAAGNLKGMIDHYRTPETQKDFAAKLAMNPWKVASFADGTKLAMETCILANATGFLAGRRGMYGPKCAHVREMGKLLPADQMLNGGLVDYALGAEPHTGAFVIVHEDHPRKQWDLAYFKMGEGPFYVFHTPFHLPHIQIASTIARAVLQRDATVTPRGAPVCDVIALTKRDLEAGERLDGVGGFMAYGVIENAPISAKQNLLPMGVSEGCRLLRNIPKDQPITYADIELPQGRLSDQLRAQQDRHFGGETRLGERIKGNS
jgi:predicted homoserine dehydrogenase-like protein